MLELLTIFSSYYLIYEFTCLIVAGGYTMLSTVTIGYIQYQGCDP